MCLVPLIKLNNNKLWQVIFTLVKNCKRQNICCKIRSLTKIIELGCCNSILCRNANIFLIILLEIQQIIIVGFKQQDLTIWDCRLKYTPSLLHCLFNSATESTKIATPYCLDNSQPNQKRKKKIKKNKIQPQTSAERNHEILVITPPKTKIWNRSSKNYLNTKRINFCPSRRKSSSASV